MALLEEACEWAASLRVADIPDDVRTLAVATLISDLAAAWAGLEHPAGPAVMRRWRAGTGAGRAARAAALTMLLDWDETCFAGHVGHSTALPALLLGAERGCDGAEVTRALVAGIELAARVTGALTLGRARGQTAAHTHLAGAAVVGGVLAGLPAGQLAGATALSLSHPREVLLPAFMGSDAKFAVAAAPLQDALTAVDAAPRATATLDILERDGGLFERLCDVPLPEAMGGYGSRWHTRTMSFKRDPGCAYISAAVEGAGGLGPVELEEVERVEIGCSIFTLGMEAESAPFIAGPATPLPALNFSVGYSVAAALEDGSLEAGDFHPETVASEARWRVAGAVTLRHDPGLTLAALAATAPMGMALAWAGERARAYLERRGAPGELAGRVLAAAAENLADPEFRDPGKRIGADIVVHLRDGRRLESGRGAATGSCQESALERLRLVEQKLRRVASAPESHNELARRLPELTAAEVRDLAAPLIARLEEAPSAA